MCRDGYNIECAEPGCEERVRCRDEMDLCPAHGLLSDDED